MSLQHAVTSDKISSKEMNDELANEKADSVTQVFIMACRESYPLQLAFAKYQPLGNDKGILCEYYQQTLVC
jgi:hypothetical protein